MALIQKAFSDIITFSRSSNATRVGPTGLVEYAPHNLVLQSQTFGTTWTPGNASVVSNAIAAPDGSVTADKLVENTSAGAHDTYQGISVSAQTYTVSVYAKPAGRDWFALRFDPGSSLRVFFNVSTGVVGFTNAAYLSASITPVGNGWYRCTATITATAATWYYVIELASANNTVSYTGDGTSGIYLWGAQLAVGPYALDYTPTTSAAVYGPRFDYDPVTLAARGLLVEEQRTNLVTWSEDFSNGSWIKNLATINANSGTAPDGTQTADKLIPTAVSSADHGVYQITAASGVGVYTVSAFVKAAGYNFADVFDGYGSALITVDLTNGSYSVVGSPIATSVTAFGNGWYRVTITRTVSGVTAYIQIRAQNDINRTAFTGDGTSGIYVWGAQSEQASFATSYIPTIGTVTRSADVASVNTLSPFYNATEGTIYAEWSMIGSKVGTGYPAIAQFDDTTSTNYIAIRQDGTSDSKRYGIVNTSSTSAQMLAGTAESPSANTVLKSALAYKANDFAFVRGTTLGTSSSGAIPSVTNLKLGRNEIPQYINAHIRRIAVYPRRLTNAELQALSA